MHFHILTLFPEMVLSGLNTSILGRACEKGLITVEAVNIRDYTEDKHKKVDDYPYGGGAGMLMQAQPVYDAFRSVVSKKESGRPARVVYVTPQGKVFHQDMARELAKEEDIIFLCGHYEGVDERVLEEIVTDYVSIGDYVLTGGELPAMVMIDAISRMVPGVLKNEESGEFESFHENLLEYPQYTRPEIWRGKRVPEVLLGGDHAKVDKWRLARSIERTQRVRPDLYEKYDLPGRALSYLKWDKLLHMDMLEDIRRNQADVICVREDGVLLKDRESGVWMVTAANKDAGERLLSMAEPDAEVFTCHQRFLAESISARFGKKDISVCFQMVYTKRAPFAEEWEFEIRQLNESFADEVFAHYHTLHTKEEIKRFLRKGAIYGAFLPDSAASGPAGMNLEADGAASGSDGVNLESASAALERPAPAAARREGAACGRTLAGFAGTHEEGSMGMLEVFEPYRRRGIAAALEKYLINRTLEKGFTPYCQVFTDNAASIRLQEKLGLKLCRKEIYWIS